MASTGLSVKINPLDFVAVFSHRHTFNFYTETANSSGNNRG